MTECALRHRFGGFNNPTLEAPAMEAILPGADQQ
jgi:hypothetical protein